VQSFSSPTQAAWPPGVKIGCQPNSTVLRRAAHPGGGQTRQAALYSNDSTYSKHTGFHWWPLSSLHYHHHKHRKVHTAAAARSKENCSCSHPQHKTHHAVATLSNLKAHAHTTHMMLYAGTARAARRRRVPLARGRLGRHNLSVSTKYHSQRMLCRERNCTRVARPEAVVYSTHKEASRHTRAAKGAAAQKLWLQLTARPERAQGTQATTSLNTHSTLL
jgi:hypothetical protein